MVSSTVSLHDSVYYDSLYYDAALGGKPPDYFKTRAHACCSSACEALEQTYHMEHRRCISSLAGFQAANDLGHPAAGARPTAVRSSQPMLST